jgi:multidrug resistance efflux pump
MSNERRIPIPLRHRIRRFQYSVLPALIFVASVVITCWLWDRQGRMPNAVGEVAPQRVSLSAGAPGLLLPVGPPDKNRPWETFDVVYRGDVVAELDPAVDEAAKAVLLRELTQLQAAVDAAVVDYNLGRANLEHEHDREARRLDWEIERRLLEKLRLDLLIAVDLKEIDRVNSELKYLEPLVAKEVVTREELEAVRLQKVVFETRVAENRRVLAEAQQQWEAAREERSKYPPLGEGEGDALLAPYREAVTAQRARIDELKLRMQKTLKIHAPIDGKIAQVFVRPGQHVLAGTPILEIAGKKGEYVVTYIRQGQGFRPTKNMLADLRARVRGRPRFADLEVEDVGAQFEQVPLHLLRDPRIMEWGLPVRIAMPEGHAHQLLPGELVDVSFKPREEKTDGE